MSGAVRTRGPQPGDLATGFVVGLFVGIAGAFALWWLS